MRTLRQLLVVMILCLLLLPAHVEAYSYGDPNKEDIAEALLVIQSKLDAAPEDWDGAYQQYLVHKKVLALEFGESVASTLDANFASKDKKLLYANYQGMLVMNLKRRFDFAEKDIQDYAKSKLLLAKAKGTFDVLAPNVKGNAAAIEASFHKALEALGNPGLFGVGKKESDPAVFKKETSAIYAALKPMFPFKAAGETASAKPAPVQAAPAAPAPQPAKPAAGTAPTEQAQPGAAAQPKAQPASNEPVVAQQPAPSTAAPAAGSDTGGTEAVSKEAPKEEAPQEPADAKKPDVESSPTKDIPSSSTQASAASTSTTDSPKPLFNTNVAAESKVSPMVTVSVISAMLLLVGGAVALMVKKGYFKI